MTKSRFHSLYCPWTEICRTYKKIKKHDARNYDGIAAIHGYQHDSIDDFKE